MIINITHGLESINVYFSIKNFFSDVINISGRFFLWINCDDDFCTLPIQLDSPGQYLS